MSTAPDPGAPERISRTSGAFGQAGATTPPASLRERALRVLRKPLEDPNPILLKELRATFRTALFIRFLYLATGFVGLFVLTLGAGFASGDTPPADVGQFVFHVFFSTVVVVLSFVAPTYAAASITGEKRSATFESLVLSGMSPARIVWGKFAASYAAIILVVIAVAPVVGMAFLFGGISPFAVATGFVWVLLWLAPATAFGIAVSARLESMWAAIVIAFVTYAGVSAFFAWPVVVALGVAAHDSWGTPEGPFWFAEAFPEVIGRWEGWAFLVLAPLYAFVIPTWFFLASAIAGIQPPAQDRSSRLKVWTVPAIAGMAVLTACGQLAFGSTEDAASFGVLASIASAGMVAFLGLLFADEPPLPPRPTGPPSLVARLLSPIGPGAAPTLRFTFLVVGASACVVPVTSSLLRWLVSPGYSDHLRFDVSLAALALGHTVIAWFFAALAAWLRLVLRNGLASRVLTLALVAGAVMVPLLVTLILAPNALERLDTEVPPLFMLSPILPTVLALAIGLENDLQVPEAFRVVVPVLGYGLLAVALWIAVEVRGVRARRLMDERRRRLASLGQPPPAPTAEPAPTAPPTS